MSRRRQREQALQILYSIDIGKGNVCSTRDLLYSLIRGEYRENYSINSEEKLPFQSIEKILNAPWSRRNIYSSFVGQVFYIKGQKSGVIKVLNIIEHVFSIFFSIFMDSTEEDRDLTVRLIEGVIEKEGYLNHIIEKYSTNWALDRISIIDVNIIRMAVYELIFIQDIPYNVTANEAVELAKKFGNEKSSRFINGILGKLIEDIIEGELV
jgi:N utilization substance protein B